MMMTAATESFASITGESTAPPLKHTDGGSTNAITQTESWSSLITEDVSEGNGPCYAHGDIALYSEDEATSSRSKHQKVRSQLTEELANQTMHVIKRDGSRQEVNFQKITRRLKKLAWGMDTTAIDFGKIVREVVSNMADHMKTEDIDKLTASVCIANQVIAPEYETLASRIAVSNLHKQTHPDLFQTWSKLEDVLHPDFWAFVQEHIDELQHMINYDLDYDFDYFGISTMQRLYCTKKDDVTIERPAHVFLRVASVVSGFDIERTKTMYTILSEKKAIFGSPTLFNAGMKSQQLASCFLLGMEDSLDGIFSTIHRMARVSKLGGGLGVNIADIRSKGAAIKGTNGKTDGIIPLIKTINAAIPNYINQSSRRKGAVAAYLSMDHPEIGSFIELRRPGGDEEARARDMFLALMVPDLFMQRLESDSMWSLFDPSECPGLTDAVGDAYVALYEQYEKEGRARKSIRARDLWSSVIRAQIESGTPYILYKDHINTKSNQSNLGTIKCSNLCAEIVEYTAPDEIAVCTLGSLCLSQYVSPESKTMDYDALMTTARHMTRALDTVIDANLYPVEEAYNSNMRHRPIGLGVQGFADALIHMKIPFDSEEACAIAEKIAAAIYYASIDESISMASEKGSYSTFQGSPAHQGKLQYDLWNRDPHPDFDWAALKARLAEHGLRNSLCVAIMPTASTAQVCGNIESVEAPTSFYYVRRTLAGEHVCLYKPLVHDLRARGLWNVEMKNAIIKNGGSIQGIATIPDDIRNLYKTAWDIKQRVVLDHAAARGPYICQTQSMNVFMPRPDMKAMYKMHMYGWKKGLKTGMYYLRSKPATVGAQVTVSNEPVSCLQCSG
jgi:ribonucleoside-diphosphate reductase alpha subunit